MQIPISAKAAFERFNRASSNSSGTSASSSSSSLPQLQQEPISQKQHNSFPAPTPKSNLLRILEVFSIKLSFIIFKKWFSIIWGFNYIMIQGKAPSQSLLDVQECCTADNNNNFSCENSQGSCSVCSESTNDSVSSEGSEQTNLPGFGWANKKPKIKSEKKISKEMAKQEKSAEGLKSFVFGLPLMEYYETQKKGCNEKCAYGRQCLKKVDIAYIGNLRENFWGSKKDKAFNPKQRLKKIQDIFMTASAVKLQEKVSI